MLLATIEYKPYMSDPERDCLTKQEVIRRYTMKDIGDLEQLPKLEGKRMTVFISPKKKKG